MPVNTKVRPARFDFPLEFDQDQVDLERIRLFKVALACEAAAGWGAA